MELVAIISVSAVVGAFAGLLTALINLNSRKRLGASRARFDQRIAQASRDGAVERER